MSWKKKGKMKKRFKGNDRFIMFLAKDIRRRWGQYGENRKYNLKKIKTKCVMCNKRATQWDHLTPVGRRPYTFDDIVPYIKRMLFEPCQPLCAECNRKKGINIC